MKTTFLYTLNDPRTGEIRYLGKSDNPFQRFKKHLCDRRASHKVHWIQSLRALGLSPTMDLLDEIPDSQWQFWEKEYVRVFRAIGIRLTNGTDGGEGPSGLVHSAETKEKLSKIRLGKKLSTGHRQKISIILRGNQRGLGYRHTPEARQKMSESRRGNQYALGMRHTPETRQKISRATRGRTLSPEHRQKLSGKTRSPEHSQKLSKSLKRYWAARKTEISSL